VVSGGTSSIGSGTCTRVWCQYNNQFSFTGAVDAPDVWVRFIYLDAELNFDHIMGYVASQLALALLMRINASTFKTLGSLLKHP